MESFDSVPFFHSAGSHLAFSSWQLLAFGNRRKQDPVLSAQDQAAFLAQRNLPNAKTTLRSYLFALCAKELNSIQKN